MSRIRTYPQFIWSQVTMHKSAWSASRLTMHDVRWYSSQHQLHGQQYHNLHTAYVQGTDALLQWSQHVQAKLV